MKCKVDIKKALIKKAINISDSQYVKLNRENTLFISQQQIFPSGYTAEKYANVIVDALNKNFGGDIASIRTNIKVDGFEIELNPSEDLVNKYYDEYLSSALGAKPIIKPGVEELFNSNPELANQVYEALGFYKTKEDYSSLSKEDRKFFEDLDRRTDSINNRTRKAISEYNKFISESNRKKIDEIKKELSELISNPEKVNKKNLDSLEIISDLQAITGTDITENTYDIFASLSKETNPDVLLDKLSELVKELDYWKNYEKEYTEITPEQKQQALQLYSQYLDTIFPNSKVKDIVYHGTDKVFDSFKTFKDSNVEGVFYTYNKDSAKIFGNILTIVVNSKTPLIEEDSVLYDSISLEAKEKLSKDYDSVITPNEMGVIFEPEQIHILGSKQDIEGFKEFTSNVKPKVLESKDRVVFGHPAIGKSFLKDKKDNRFISLDDDYSAEIKTNVENIANTYNVTTYQVKDGGNQKWNKEYDAMMQNLFDVARKRAISENKTLFTSNTNLLKNNINSFDKVINISDEEFFKRIKQRQEKGGAKYDIKEWKSQINNAISKVPASKVINTDKFLSDLLQEPSNLNNAKTLLEKVEPINNEKLFSDLANLIFTEDVIRYLHKENMSRLSLETYAKEVQILADNLIGLGYTKEEVLTTIKCL